jgi:hypothetical protein
LLSTTALKRQRIDRFIGNLDKENAAGEMEQYLQAQRDREEREDRRRELSEERRREELRNERMEREEREEQMI